MRAPESRIRNFIERKIHGLGVTARRFAARSAQETPYFLKYSWQHFGGVRNVGDALTPYLWKKITGKNPPPNIGYGNPAGLANFMLAGSILQFADAQSIVWGSGIDEGVRGIGYSNWEEARSVTRLVKPKRICAVRGPLTREKLLELELECPEIYGDPGLLMPCFYRPPTPPVRHELGIVLHFSHENSTHLPKLRLEEARFIPVNQPPERFVEALASCRRIASSSLHGLIFADAYGIPSLWIRPFDHMQTDTTFKFRDYFRSVGRSDESPFIIDKTTGAADLISAFRPYTIHFQPERLLAACPFKDYSKGFLT